jgi:hypothetical protein
MPSEFAWVDFSEKERKKMMDVIQFFKEKDTRDELGIGSVRDAFANLLFPGTSTIHTRVKYMLLVPWIYLRHEERKTPSKYIKDKARSEEINLIKPLLASIDTDGVIGKEAGASLQRLPSNIYWSGLGTWGIRRFSGSQEQYHRNLDYYYYKKKNQLLAEDKEPANEVPRVNWDPALPSPSANFPSSASLILNEKEAEYLYDRIMVSCKGSLLAYLVDQTSIEECDFVWKHSKLVDFPQELKDLVYHAKNFSLIIHGAALLYNLMLAEKAESPELITEYQEMLDGWAQEVSALKQDFSTWNLDIFWQTVESKEAQITDITKNFISTWIEAVLEKDNLASIKEDTSVRQLIRNRELRIKGSRARLINQRALEQWTGAAGTRRLNYRWNIVNGMVTDILTALKGEQSG